MFITPRLGMLSRWIGLLAVCFLVGCIGQETKLSISTGDLEVSDEATAKSSETESNSSEIAKQSAGTATFGGGCFWCVEAVFDEMEGVKSAVSGYAGGTTKNPTYRDVCTGMTGHAEVCQIDFDPSLVSFKELLEVFFKTHDPTTLNRQGNDIGTQYRSVIMYHDDEQKKIAEEYIKKLDESGEWSDPVTTQVVPATEFYIAEKEHQDYYVNNPSAPYCLAVVGSKVKKFRDVFPEKRKKPE